MSADSELDVLIVKFRRMFYTSVNQLPVVYLKNDISIPKQQSENKYEEMVSNALQSSVPVLNVGTGLMFATSLFVNFGLLEILGNVKCLVILCTLYSANF